MASEKKEFHVPLELSGQRIDSVIQSLMPEFSRTRIQKWIREGYVKVDQLPINPKKKLSVENLFQLIFSLMNS